MNGGYYRCPACHMLSAVPSSAMWGAVTWRGLKCYSCHADSVVPERGYDLYVAYDALEEAV